MRCREEQDTYERPDFTYLSKRITRTPSRQYAISTFSGFQSYDTKPAPRTYRLAAGESENGDFPVGREDELVVHFTGLPTNPSFRIPGLLDPLARATGSYW